MMDSEKRDELDDLIDRYFEMLPEIRGRHGFTWALLADGALVKTFDDYSAAADYAVRRFGRQQVLIRHTEEKPDFLPYVHLIA